MSPEVPTSIRIGNQNITFREIHNNFSKTQPGKTLFNQTRWTRYQGNLNNNEWQKIMGFDINNLEHGRLTYKTARLFINHINQSDSKIKFNQQEQKLLLLTSIAHDWPEGITKDGDITYDKKTKQHETEELAVIERIITDILGPKSLDISKQVKDILEEKTSKLGMAFNAIERIGYLKTGLTAWKKSKIVDENISTNLMWVTNNATINHLSKLIEYSSIYPPIKGYLKNHQDQISEAFNEMPNTIFNKYESLDEKNEKIDKFNTTYQEWNKWTNNRLNFHFSA